MSAHISVLYHTTGTVQIEGHFPSKSCLFLKRTLWVSHTMGYIWLRQSVLRERKAEFTSVLHFVMPFTCILIHPYNNNKKKKKVPTGW